MRGPREYDRLRRERSRAGAIALAMVSLLLVGCRVEEFLSINADGSGTHRVQVSISEALGIGPEEMRQALQKIEMESEAQGYHVVGKTASSVTLERAFSDVSELSDKSGTYSLSVQAEGLLRRSYTLRLRLGAIADGFERIVHVRMPVTIAESSAGRLTGRELQWDGSGGALEVKAVGTVLPVTQRAKLLAAVLIGIAAGLVVATLTVRRRRALVCRNCGLSVGRSAKFCEGCGGPVLSALGKGQILSLVAAGLLAAGTVLWLVLLAPKRPGAAPHRVGVSGVESLNLRTQPAADAPVVGKARKGERFEIVGEQGEWVQVQTQAGVNAWVARRFVGIDGEEAPAACVAEDASRQEQTIRSMRNLGTALFSWLTDQVGASAAGAQVGVQNYPLVSGEDVARFLVPKYIAEVPATDGWGHSFDYHVNLANPLAKTVFLVRSPGKDGRFGGDDYEVAAFDSSDCNQDIVWADGFFVRWPGKVSTGRPQ